MPRAYALRIHAKVRRSMIAYGLRRFADVTSEMIEDFTAIFATLFLLAMCFAGACFGCKEESF